MARLNNAISYDSDDEEFPDLSTILKRSVEVCAKEKSEGRGGTSEKGKEKEKEQEAKSMHHGIIGSPKSVTKASCDEKRLRKQRALGLAHVNSLRLPLTKEPLRKKFNRDEDLDFRQGEIKWSTPGRAVKVRVDHRTFSPSTPHATFSEDDVSFDDLSDFIVDDSASDVEEAPSRTRKPRREFAPGGEKVRLLLKSAVLDLTSPKKSSKTPTILDLTSPKKSSKTLSVLDSISPKKSSKIPSVRSSNTEDTSQKTEVAATVFNEEPGACLRFSPPTTRSVHKSTDQIRPTTPPSSPSKPSLHSPSKRFRIPPSPHRPSIDAFWNPEVINDWNDQYSPRKTPHSERSRRLISISEDDESEPSPSGSPRRSPIKSPVKKDTQEIQRRKLFNEKKNGLAASFLKDVDKKTTNGQITALAASSGGIHIVWSKKLRSTAGRANWRRETLRTKNPDGTVSTTTYRHHASIELAEKIIDDEDRLFNTIAHEYCHLANFMISGIKDNPHGKEFKEWAHKVTCGFSHLAIHVTTKHSYAITYKFIWACTQPACGLEYKRHSRSIDPTRHRCGKCRGSLTQLKPIPRDGTNSTRGGAAVMDAKGRGGRYQEYVQKHFARVRSENPTLGMAGWMVELGRGFREERAKGLDPAGVMGESVSEGVVIHQNKEEDETMDSVARKLDFLSLCDELIVLDD